MGSSRGQGPPAAGDPPPRVLITDAAADLLLRLQRRHGPVMFHQSGGCCDGSSPMCYPDGEFIVGDRDVLLGVLNGAPVWISGPQFETWKHTQLTIDVVPGRGGGFSLEAPDGVRFLIRGRVFTDDELALLAASPPMTGADLISRNWQVGAPKQVPGSC
ncbi:MAG TPA: DUF779 domain-containing protein [Mycobacterium sp.]|nr:DUF779 domain-containing protein [Mycobacterium sp.]